MLRLLPGWYREQWEEDIVAAFLDSWLTGDPEADEYISKAAGPSWAEVASVAALAARLYLAGQGVPRRYAWGQAARLAVLCVTLVQAIRGLDILVQTDRLEPPSVRLAPRCSREHRGHNAWRPLAARGVVPGCLRLDSGLRNASPRVLPDSPGHRSAGHHP